MTKIDLSQYSTAHLLTPEKYKKILKILKKTEQTGSES